MHGKYQCHMAASCVHHLQLLSLAAQHEPLGKKAYVFTNRVGGFCGEKKTKRIDY